MSTKDGPHRKLSTSVKFKGYIFQDAVFTWRVFPSGIDLEISGALGGWSCQDVSACYRTGFQAAKTLDSDSGILSLKELLSVSWLWLFA